MELEEAIKILKEDLEHIKRANECGLATKGEFNKEIEAIEFILNHLTKQDKMIDELKNGVHYQECINCGKEIRVKRIDAKYCNECAKLKQKEYFKNMPDEKKKERAEKSKQYMRELRAKRKAKESE